MSPAVAVCIPVFNGERHLHQCLESVLGQSERDLEIIVVDNCSDDTSLEIAEAYAARDRRVRVHRNPRNIGLVGNLNRCVELAESPWIKFAFHDDRLAPTCIERMVEGPPASLVVCRRDFAFEGVERYVRRSYLGLQRWDTLETMFPGRREIDATAFLDAALRHIGLNFVGEPTATLLRTASLQRVSGFDPDLVQLCDWDLWLRIGGGDGLRFVNESLATFRIHTDAASSANRQDGAYRARYLDPVRILRKMVADPAYAPVRTHAAERGFSIDDLTLRYGLRAEVAASRFATSRRQPDGRPLEAWRGLLAADPGLASLLDARTSAIRRLTERYLWQTQLPLGPVRWLVHPAARHVARSGRAVTGQLRKLVSRSP